MRIITALSILILATNTGFAAPLSKKDVPVEITADSLEVVQPNQTAIFRGAVRVTQGDMNMTSATMTVHYREGKNTENSTQQVGAVSRIEAEGGVLLSTREETVRGEKGVYDVDAGIVRMLNNVVLTRGKNVLKGNNLVYNLNTGKSLLNAGGEPALGDKKAGGDKKTGSGRVKAVFVPEGK